jgi:outer membrane protein assembly factor BamB
MIAARFHVLFVLIALAAATRAGRAQDWPQFRGPTGQGVSAATGLPGEWSESKNIIWKTAVAGSGWSSPVIAGGRVWVTTFVDKGSSLRALAFDAETGKALVDVEVFTIKGADPINPKNSRASPTPVVDGDRVYVHFGADGTAALTTAGEVVWKTRFSYSSQHGSGGSPVVVGDLLIVSCDGPDAAFLVALDKVTGKQRWKTWKHRPWDQAYSTPLLITVGGRDEIVSVGAYHTAAYDPRTGKEIWGVNYPDGFSNVPRPVYGDGIVYVTTGFQQPSLVAIRADGAGDVTRTHIAWTLARAAPLTPSPLLLGEALYVVNDGGIAMCLNANTGAPAWVQRLPGTYSASPVFADGRIYFLNEDGVATVIAPGAEFGVLATNRLDGTTYASMAVSSGSFFIRTDRSLYRIGGGPPAPAWR